MKHNRFMTLLTAFVLGMSLLSMTYADSSVKAEALTLQVSLTPSPTALPTPLPRMKTSQISVDGYLWWLVEWGTNEVVCNLKIDHDGNPIGTDILYGCGQDVYNKWAATDSCLSPYAGKNQDPCSGLYLYFVKPVILVRETTVEIPPPEASVSLSSDCRTDGITHHCKNNPSLVITGFEPMEGQSIISIEGELDGISFICDTNPCIVSLNETGPEGVHAMFWANSNFGDSSKHYTAAVRLVPLDRGNSLPIENPEKWQADVATAQWGGAPLAACSQSWEALPDASGLPDWLGTPSLIESMASSNKYYYLAGQLIRSGQVNAGDCANYGLASPLTANACGLQKSAQLVVKWQNQFDNIILAVAQTENMPANVMKNIIGRESQFWPGVYSGMDEVGLGQMTEGGADTLFMWNPKFYSDFCATVFEKAECAKGYNNIPEYEKGLLKGALLSKLNTSCSDCISKVDLDKVHFSVDVLSSSLKSNCEQTGQLIYNWTDKAAGSSMSYEDLWRLTLVNYNAGSGCLNEAIKKTTGESLPLNWDNISTRLDTGCQGAIDYVNDITQYSVPNIPTTGGILPITPMPTPLPITEPPTSSN